MKTIFMAISTWAVMANIGKWPYWLLWPFKEMAINMAFLGVYPK
jgi:hypothetical protein